MIIADGPHPPVEDMTILKVATADKSGLLRLCKAKNSLLLAFGKELLYDISPTAWSQRVLHYEG